MLSYEIYTPQMVYDINQFIKNNNFIQNSDVWNSDFWLKFMDLYNNSEFKVYPQMKTWAKKDQQIYQDYLHLSPDELKQIFIFANQNNMYFYNDKNICYGFETADKLVGDLSLLRKNIKCLSTVTMTCKIPNTHDVWETTHSIYLTRYQDHSENFKFELDIINSLKNGNYQDIISLEKWNSIKPRVYNPNEMRNNETRNRKNELYMDYRDRTIHKEYIDNKELNFHKNKEQVKELLLKIKNLGWNIYGNDGPLEKEQIFLFRIPHNDIQIAYKMEMEFTGLCNIFKISGFGAILEINNTYYDATLGKGMYWDNWFYKEE